MRVRCHTSHAIELARSSIRYASCVDDRPATTACTTPRIRPNASTRSSAPVIVPPPAPSPRDARYVRRDATRLPRGVEEDGTPRARDRDLREGPAGRPRDPQPPGPRERAELADGVGR